MKKVLFIATVVKTHINTFHLPYLKWFKEQNYEVHVAAKNDYNVKGDLNIPHCDVYYDLPFERFPFHVNNIKTYLELKKIIDMNQYDIIHCHTPVGGAIGRLAARKSRQLGTEVIYTAHGFHFFKGAPLINWLIYYPVEKLLSQYTDTLITINEEDYKRAQHFYARRTEYVPGVGIDVEKIENTLVDRKKKRKSIQVPINSFMVLSVGELNENKNHQTIIQAIARINQSNIHYVIAGEGPLSEDLLNLALKLEVNNQVHQIGYRADIEELCLVSDLFVFPSYREGLSVSVMEAMAAGLPIVASDIRGNTDLIQSGGGYLEKPTDIDGFARSINEIYQLSEEKRKKIGIFNKKFIKKFDQKRIMEKMSEIYQER